MKNGGNLLNVICEGNKINFVKQYKYLRIIIDNHINLNKNLNSSSKRDSTLLERLRPYLKVDATIKVYLSMIVPIMTYSSAIQIPCNDTQCKSLQSLDRRANSKVNSPTLRKQLCMMASMSSIGNDFTTTI